MLPRSRLLVIEWFHNWWRVDWCRVELWEQNRCYWWYRSWNGRACGQLSAWIWRWINWLHAPRCIFRACQVFFGCPCSIGEVSVTMIGPDSQVSYLGGYVHFGSWSIASSCGWWSRLDWDRYQCLWPKQLLAFYLHWWAWLWINCRSRHTRSIHLDTRIEAGHSILRTHLCFKCNGIQSIHHTLPAISNTVPTPTCTSIGSELLSI